MNLERAMPMNGRLGGHIVTGHIDGTGRISSVRRDKMRCGIKSIRKEKS